MPIKRNRSFSERYKELIQEEVDKRMCRAQKTKKKSRKTQAAPKKPLLQAIEEKRSTIGSEAILEKNLQIVKERSLPAKYLKLLSKTLRE